MRIASWNVNSFKVRADHLSQFLAESGTDIIGLQELKGETIDTAPLKTARYHVEYVGQKAYNGVAIATRHMGAVVATRLAGDADDTQARYIEMAFPWGNVLNCYMPNGNPLGTEKFTYKLAWLKRLHARVAALRTARTPFVLLGDFNIIPMPIDCYDPLAWAGDALFQPESRGAYQALLNTGMVDAFRHLHTDTQAYTFWDYQAGCWPRNLGIRIDHILLSPTLVPLLRDCQIDRTPRGWEKASDHTPIWIDLDV
ncbi:MAG: exodeoxyribonuclease III [Pseudomonadota bacterium]